ncbi:MAG: hypothetical protein HWD82_07140 [Flavobacteriaceae bacterium]|nr:hypothetical protein [Flavobacteriaceae bacterium]
MKKLFLFTCLFSVLQLQSQNKQILYDFADLPQTLLLNPAIEPSYKFHVGLPFLSGISSNIGSSNFKLTDIFANDGRSINDKISSIINSISSRDFGTINTQIEIINAGFRLRDNYYINFGFYQEIDAIGYFPRDLLVFFNEGNATNLNRPFSASHIRYKFDYLGVLHAGISKIINDKLSVGGRLKIYSSSINLQSNNNTGTFTTVNGQNSIYRHIFSNVNINLLTSGLIEDNEFVDDAKSIIKNTFFGSNSNVGLGFDFGLNYKISDQLQFSASLLDVGFITYKNNVKNTRIRGDHIFEGVEFEYDANSNLDYWGQIDQAFKDQLPNTEDEVAYTSFRPVKLNAALKYSFGEKRRLLCYNEVYKDYYENAIGAQLFSVSRPLTTQLALTLFYEKELIKNTWAKLTYTVDDFSYTNISFGFSTQVSKFNFYIMADNLLEFSNLSAANSLSFQLGFNLLFN